MPQATAVEPLPGTRARAAVSPTWFAASVAGGAASLLALWWHNSTISGPGSLETNAGRIAGLLAGYGVLVQLLLRARIPAIERGLGTGLITAWHASGGRWLISLALAHATLIIIGYSSATGAGPGDEVTLLLVGYPGVLMAAVALALLVGVAMVSARAVRRRVRYETWQYLHLYAYLAAALAFNHQLANGQEFRKSHAAAFIWTAMYVSVAAALVWYRFLSPVRLFVRHRFEVGDVLEEGPGVVSLLISGRRLDELDVEAGQYFRWRFITRDGWWAANPYSLSSPPHRNGLRITVRAVGDHSTLLASVEPGTKVIAEGPCGGFTAAHRTRSKVLLIAGGIGITPLRSLLETLTGRPGEITMIYRASRESDVVFRQELDALATARGARVVYLTGSRADAVDPLAVDGLKHLVGDLRAHDVYVCGPPGMTATVIDSLRRAGVGRRHIFTESFLFTEG